MSSVAGKVLIIPKGDYDSSETYEVLDQVLYNGLPYIAKQTTTGNAPTNTTYWAKLVDMPTTVDNVPTQNSNNLVKSGGVYSALSDKADASTAYSTSDSTETIADADYVPFYDTSASAKKKTLWSSLVSTLTAVFTGATSVTAGAKGTVPAPAAGDEGKFLKGDGTWGTVASPSTMTGADGTNAGTSGLAPAPAATDNTKFLKGDASYDNESWANVKNKPFDTMVTSYSGHSGFYLEDGALYAHIEHTISPEYGGTSNTYKYFSLEHADGLTNEVEIPGTGYVEDTRTLSTSTTTTFTFTQPESIFPSDATYDVASSIYGVNPDSVTYSSSSNMGTITVVFPKHTSAVSLTCRVFVKKAAVITS